MTPELLPNAAVDAATSSCGQDLSEGAVVHTMEDKQGFTGGRTF